jgi:hypothetical protein
MNPFYIILEHWAQIVKLRCIPDRSHTTMAVRVISILAELLGFVSSEGILDIVEVYFHLP